MTSGLLVRWLECAVAAGAVWGVAAADVSYFGVLKTSRFSQGLQGPPAPLATNGFLFDAFVVPSTNNAVTGARVQPPGTRPARTLGAETNGIAWRFEGTFQDQAALDDAFPSSASLFSPSVYSLTFQTLHDGERTATVSYWLVSAPPTAQIGNLEAAQSVDTTADFTLQWSTPGGTILDLVQLVVIDGASNIFYSSPMPFQAGALNGSSTSTVLPASALPPGAALEGHLVVARPGLPNTNSYPGAIGVAGLARDTGFPLATRPAPVPPTLAVTAGQPIELRFSGERDRWYRLQGSPDLKTWSDLAVTHSPSGTGTWVDAASTNLPRRFYRAAVGTANPPGP